MLSLRSDLSRSRVTVLLTILGAAPLTLTTRISAQPVAPADPLAGDARLESRLAVTAEGISLAELLPKLGAPAGVRLRAEGPAADDKVVVLAPVRPLRETLADLAALLGSAWSARSEGDAREYILRREPSAVRREDSLATAAERQALEGLDTEVRALREPPSQVRRRPDDDPLREILLDPRARLALGIYSRLAPEQRRFLLERGQLRIFFDALPPEVQQGMLELARAQAQQPEVRISGQRFATVQRQSPPDVELHADWRSNSTVSLRMYPEGILFGRVRTTRPSLPLRGDPFAAAPGPPPALPAGIEVPDPRPGEWLESLRALAARTRRPLLADFYRLHCEPYGLRPVPAGADPASRLDALARAHAALWWTRGESLLLRRSDWYDRRRYEIPDRWLDATIAALRSRNGAAAWGDLARLGELSFQQQIGLMLLGERCGPLDACTDYPRSHLLGLPEALALLRAGPVRPAERLANFDQEGVGEEGTRRDFAQMPPAQRARILPLLAAGRRELDGFDPESFFFTLGHREPRANKAGTYRYVPVELRWHATRTGGDLEVRLPLEVPEDHRGKVVVSSEW